MKNCTVRNNSSKIIMWMLSASFVWVSMFAQATPSLPTDEVMSLTGLPPDGQPITFTAFFVTGAQPDLFLDIMPRHLDIAANAPIFLSVDAFPDLLQSTGPNELQLLDMNGAIKAIASWTSFGASIELNNFSNEAVNEVHALRLVNFDSHVDVNTFMIPNVSVDNQMGTWGTMDAPAPQPVYSILLLLLTTAYCLRRKAHSR